jgi:uncharacterized protein YjbI with pentapeptide repeats
MGARLRSWWRQLSQRRVAIVVTAAIIVVAVALIIVGYQFDVTGFNGYTQVSTIRSLSGPSAGTVTRTEVYQPGKTLWDWLQLLIVPIVLAVGGYVINLTISRGEQEATRQRAKTEQEIASDNQREMALQDYIDKLSELLLHEKLRELKPEYEEVRKIARVRTLTVLPRLDKERKRSVLQFLYESDLIYKGKSIIDLDGAFLSEANLSKAELTGANLSKANLSGANLSGAFVWEANLREANLSKANLSGAILGGTNLSRANLGGANLREAFLNGTNLSGANLSGADLKGADLKVSEDDLPSEMPDANLSRANLFGAKVATEQLDKARSLKGATMPDGSIHP